MSERDERNQLRRGSLTATGVALVALGVLILLPLGLCATALGFGIAIQATTYELTVDAFFVLAFIVFGAAMIYAAWKTVYQGWNMRK